MKKILLLGIILLSGLCFGQENINKPIIATISNLKLGLDEKYIIEKYGEPEFDTIYNSTRRIQYKKIKLDNNYVVEHAAFTFFKKKLFTIIFDFNNDIHHGLSAKYGYHELDDKFNVGYYGNFDKNIIFRKIMTNEPEEYIFLLLDEIKMKLSMSEGF